MRMERTLRVAGAQEPCSIRIQVDNGWNAGVLFIPRLKVE
jgi:hypothetical protein